MKEFKHSNLLSDQKKSDQKNAEIEAEGQRVLEEETEETEETEEKTEDRERSWLYLYSDRRMLLLAFLGFSSGLPLLLIASTLSLWLKDAQVSLTAIGLFAWVLFPYKIKFLWAPIVDRVRLPFFGPRCGLRRSWLWFTQLGLIGSLFALSMIDPREDLYFTALYSIIIAVFSATQDIVIDGYRVEILSPEEQGAGAAVAVFGYRIGMIISGAGALYVAEFYGWAIAYQVMAVSLSLGVIATFFAHESKEIKPTQHRQATESIFHFLKRQAIDGFIHPISEVFKRRGALLFLFFIMLYRVGDALANKMVPPFLVEAGFTKIEIANIAKSFGIVASIIGVVLGGFLVKYIGVLRALWVGGLMQMTSNFAFSVQAIVGHNVWVLVGVETVYQITGGIGMAAFTAYLSSLSSRESSATHYALLTAISGMLNMSLSSLSGLGATHLGWPLYFSVTALTALPGMVLLWFMIRWKMSGLPEHILSHRA